MMKNPVRVVAVDNQIRLGIPAKPIDEVNLEDADPVLLAGQEDAAENGTWIIHQGDWERRDPLSELQPGDRYRCKICRHHLDVEGGRDTCVRCCGRNNGN